MISSKVRKSIYPFRVETGDGGERTIQDIYITELGNVMISVFDEKKKVTVNYPCGKIWDFLPRKIKIR